MDPAIEEQNGIKFVWNLLPSNRNDMTKIVIPVGFHYTPIQKNEAIPLLEYDPLTCPKCKCAICPFFFYSVKAKVWECPFCRTKVGFPKAYADYISEEILPIELMPENTTVEYKLNKKEANWPIFIFLVDTAVEEEELNELKESIQQTINNLPQECSVGIITYGKMCNVHEIGFSEFPVSYALNGEKAYKPNEIHELLRLASTQSRPKFIMPVSEVSFSLSSFLDDLQPDPWGKKKDERDSNQTDVWEKQTKERDSNCVGLAINTAVSLLEAISRGEPARILTFMGGAGTIGEGAIVGKSLKETIRNFVDFEKGNENTHYYKPACEFYDQIALRAAKSNIIIDIFSCCLNQVGLYEMKNLVAKTGGYMIFTDSFSTMIFKDSLKKMFVVDESGNLSMCFKAKLDYFCTENIKISGALGHMLSIEAKSPIVSDIKIGEGNTRSWLLGGINANSTYTFILDTNNTTDFPNKDCFIQLVTTYVAGDRSYRMRVSTIKKKIIQSLSSPESIDQIGNSFDQEAAVVLLTRMCIHKGETEEPREILKWVDKTLLRLMSKFAQYFKGISTSFKLTPKFQYFPQFMFYLRRSTFIQSFNESPDESIYYKTALMLENVVNCTIMIQPLLFEYTAEKPEAIPIYLDLESMKNDVVLLLDTYFYVVVWHGNEVCKWREEGLQYQQDYVNIKMMLDKPQDYAQTIVIDRLPTPRFVSCDSGSGQERLVKCIVNPSQESKNKIKDDGFFSDDVSLKVFMDYLKRLSVNN